MAVVLSPRKEQHYSQIEIKSAEVEYGNTKYHIYLYGLEHYYISTDHKPLLSLFNTYKHEMPHRLLKNKIYIQGYNYTLIHEPGASNPTDYMSRHPQSTKPHLRSEESAKETELFINVAVQSRLPDALTMTELENAAKRDPEMMELKLAITQEYISNEQRKLLQSSYQQVFEELSICGDIIVRESKIVVPKQLRQKAVELSHEGHQRIVKSKQYLRSHLWFPGIDSQVTQMVEKCLPCQAATDKTQREPLKSIPLPAVPWSSLRVDLYGPVPGSRGEYLLVVQCLYPRFPAVEIISSTCHKAVIPALDRIMSAFGIPDKLGSDNDSGQEYHVFARYMGFQFDPVTPLAP